MFTLCLPYVDKTDLRTGFFLHFVNIRPPQSQQNKAHGVVVDGRRQEKATWRGEISINQEHGFAQRPLELGSSALWIGGADTWKHLIVRSNSAAQIVARRSAWWRDRASTIKALIDAYAPMCAHQRPSLINPDMRRRRHRVAQ